MKILYIVPSLIQAGPVNVVLDLVNVMQGHGHLCEVAYMEDRNDRAHNVFPCNTMRLNMLKEIDLGQFDIVHSHGFRPDMYVRLHGRKCRNQVRFVSTMHNYVFRELRIKQGRLRALLQGNLVLYAAAGHHRIVTLRESARDYYARWLPRYKLRVCCNTRIIDEKVADADDCKKIETFRQGVRYVIGTNCTICWLKNLNQVVEALPMMPEVGFVIVGDGVEMEALRAQAERLGVSDRVLFLGRRPSAYRYIPLYDLFVIPSRSEGFPLGLLEAAALGKASASSDIDAFKDTFEETEVPRFKLDDPADLARVVTDALERREELGRRIKARFERDYSPEAFYEQHIKVYTD